MPTRVYSDSVNISFADDTGLYNSVSEVEDCDVLQSDLNTIYKRADANNMAFNSNKFKYVCFTPSESVSQSIIYLCPKMNLIDKVENIKDLGITISSNTLIMFTSSVLASRGGF